MDFKNEKSKIYTVGSILLGIGVLLPNILVFVKKYEDVKQAIMMTTIGQIFLAALFVLLGTRDLVARKSKLGYFLYFVSGFILISLILRLKVLA
ncbi:MAG: hypothetical protein ACOYVK_07065 [Bacillota bacterium]